MTLLTYLTYSFLTPAVYLFKNHQLNFFNPGFYMSFVSLFDTFLTVSLLPLLYCNLTDIVYFCFMKLLEQFLKEELNVENPDVLSQFDVYNRLILDWNSKINLVSRKNTSIENIVLNSIFFLTKYEINPNAKILDIGTGGGFPGIPLKILYPGLNVTLVDSIRKKINALKDIIPNLKLVNAKALCCRAEELMPDYKGMFDYIVSKSVAPLSDLADWGIELLNNNGKMLCIKGGDMSEEIHAFKTKYKYYSLGQVEFSFDPVYNIDDKKLILIKKSS
jgi:16S rRNA (guanine527-N7)-methyltransferase